MYLRSLLSVRFVHFTEDVGEQPVSPVTSDGVQYTVQFNHCSSLGIQYIQFGSQAQSNGGHNDTLHTIIMC